ncbi:MAG: PHP domain-containing protein [Treponema sp.]|nr:PHP domain-containing protein [Treponema sp.]MCL2237329.1 PHP domain-containing protein [Treponema sp.]
MVDLHTHSNISDGDLSPALLVREAAKTGIRALALTDHDTIYGLESAKAAAKLETVDGKPFHFIPGIEVNINWQGLGPGGEFHLLGLGIKSPTSDFISAVEWLSRRREVRNREILDRMHEFSIEATWEELLEIAGAKNGNGSVGRPHFAALLIKHKVVKNVKQAFARYLGVGKPLYVPKDGLKFEDAVSLIRQSGGIPILAHPISLFIAWGRLPDVIKKLKDLGLAGLEAWHPTAKQGACRRLEALAQELGLYVTEGSDFHGSLRPDRRLGYSSRGRKISDTILEAIPELY